MPFFSVIIPVYEGESTIEETLRSVTSQSFTDYEIVLVNDGSTDTTGSLLRSFKKAHPQRDITLIEQDNRGLGAARNAAIQAATGKYCVLLDADDLWKPEKLEVLHQEIIRHEPAMLYHPVVTFGLQKHWQRKAWPVKSIRELVLKGNPIVPSAVALFSDLAKAHPFVTDEAYHGAEDLFLWITLLHEGHDLHFFPASLTLYREEGGMSSRLDEHLKKVISVFRHFAEAEVISAELLEKAIRRKHYEAARFYHKRSLHREAGWHYSASRSYAPKSLALRLMNYLRIST